MLDTTIVTIRLKSFLFIILLVSNTIVAGEALVISNGATKSPMHREHFDGFVDLVLLEALKRIDHKMDIRGLPNERSLMNANRGLIDGEAQRISGMENNYPNLIRVPEKIMDWQFVVFSKKNINTSEGWKSLMPYTTAFITGWKIFEYNVPIKTSVMAVKNEEIMFTLLQRDRIDIVLYELWQGLDFIKKHNYNDIKVSSPPIANREMFTYLHKKHARLVPKLAQALKDMKNDGTYNRIHDPVLGHLKNN